MATSRLKQIQALQSKAENLQMEVADLMADMQEALDSLPENLKNGERAELMQERIDLLEGWNTELENIATEEV